MLGEDESCEKVGEVFELWICDCEEGWYLILGRRFLFCERWFYVWNDLWVVVEE